MYKINKITPDKHEFTQLLPSIDKTIKSLHFIGLLPASERPSIAIVGTRKPTTYGREVGERLAFELAQRGVVVISGLALGIDGIVHRAALAAGGTAVAVLPTSIEDIHPHAHRQLAREIVAKDGALISEYGPDDYIGKGNFVARNRIVSALADGVLVIEATARSGTLATVGFALSQGKPVMAVPGNITSPTSAGCNNIIKQGGRLVTAVDEILEEIGFSPQSAGDQLPLAHSRQEWAILEPLQHGVRDGDELQKQSGLDSAEFSQTLTMLEIEGKIYPLGGNQWTVKL